MHGLLRLVVSGTGLPLYINWRTFSAVQSGSEDFVMCLEQRDRLRHMRVGPGQSASVYTSAPREKGGVIFG